MLKLLRWEWETKFKRPLIPSILVIIALYVIRRDLLAEDTFDIICRLAPIIGERVITHLLIPMAGFVFLILLFTGGSSLWKELGKGGDLLFTMPEPAYKILAAAFVTSLFFTLIFVVYFAIFQLLQVSWWPHMLNRLILLCTAGMLMMFAVVLKKTVAVGKWYGGLVYIVAGLLIFSLIVAGILIDVLTEYPYAVQGRILLMLFQIAMSAILFFASAYLLENKLDLWE